jgi:hypothetical protein
MAGELPCARQEPRLLGLEDLRVGVVARVERADRGWRRRSFRLLQVDAKLVAAAVEPSRPASTISSLATAITKLSSVSRSAMVDTEDGKNCGVSAATTKP